MNLAAKIETLIKSCADTADYGCQTNQHSADGLQAAEPEPTLHFDGLAIPIKSAIGSNSELTQVAVRNPHDALRPMFVGRLEVVPEFSDSELN